jgi:hypothetical protein
MSGSDLERVVFCGWCSVELKQRLWGALVAYGGLWSPRPYCSPVCRDRQDAVWQEWYAPERR